MVWLRYIRLSQGKQPEDSMAEQVAQQFFTQVQRSRCGNANSPQHVWLGPRLMSLTYGVGVKVRVISVLLKYVEYGVYGELIVILKAIFKSRGATDRQPQLHSHGQDHELFSQTQGISNHGYYSIF